MKIIINCNDCFAAYTFRLPLIKRLQQKHDVYVVAGFDGYTRLLKEEGIKVIISKVEATSTNVFQDCNLIRFYKRTFRKIEPDVLINYTLKPHLYGSYAAFKNTRVINFVSGTSSIFIKRNLLFYLIRFMYQLIAKKVDYYIFLNKDDCFEFKQLKILKQPYSIINSEGVALDRFYPDIDFKKPLTFIFVGRLVKEKGIVEYLEAAQIVKNKYPDVRFLVVGGFYQKKSAVSKKIIDEYHQNEIIEYLGYRYDINEVLKDVHCVVLPSYREGMPISLIEGLASKKVIIASDVIGCREVVKNGYNGFLVKPKSSFDLANKLEEYINYPNKETLHHQALLSSKQYDVAKITDKLVDIIENI